MFENVFKSRECNSITLYVGWLVDDWSVGYKKFTGIFCITAPAQKLGEPVIAVRCATLHPTFPVCPSIHQSVCPSSSWLVVTLYFFFLFKEKKLVCLLIHQLGVQK